MENIYGIILKTEQREGYFATRTTPFGITTYGDTCEKAEQRAIQAVSLLLDRYKATPKTMSDFLNHRGVDKSCQDAIMVALGLGK